LRGVILDGGDPTARRQRLVDDLDGAAARRSAICRVALPSLTLRMMAA
jgi:hypothetical protein